MRILIDGSTGEILRELKPGEYIGRRKVEKEKNSLDFHFKKTRIRSQFVKLYIQNLKMGKYFEGLSGREMEFVLLLGSRLKKGQNLVQNRLGRPLSLKELGKELGIKNIYEVSAKLKKRGIILVENGKIYVNPLIMSNGKEMNDSTLDMFWDINGEKLKKPSKL